MTKTDKLTIYRFVRTAAAAAYGYVPTALRDDAPAFTDDTERTAPASVIARPKAEAISYQSVPPRKFEIASRVAQVSKIAMTKVAGTPPSLASISTRISSCTSCPLCRARTQAVPGMGVEHPVVLVVGEGPGHDEDISGLPFVGPAGQLLDKMLAAISLDRHKNAFIANVVKCRPPNNRTPTPQEAAACLPFLNAQIGVLHPRFILAMGRTAGQALLGTTGSLASMRGAWRTFGTTPMIITYHPSALLRDPGLKRFAWEDLKVLRARLLAECPGYDK